MTVTSSPDFYRGIDLRGEQIDAMRALVIALQFVGVALEEMSSSRRSGFGVLDPAFEKDYAEFLLKLRVHLDITQRFLGNGKSDAPSSG